MTTGYEKSVLERAMDAEGKTLSGDAARSLLKWHLTDEDNRRMDELGEKAKAGSINEAETEQFREFCEAVDLISLLHLRAKEALGQLKRPGE